MRATGVGTVTNLKATNLRVSGVTTFLGNVNLEDNDRLQIGTGDDLEIYHSGTRSYISDTTGQGDLRILTNEFAVMDSTETDYIIRATENSDVKLYFNASEKAATEAYGFDVTGTITVDSISNSGVSTFGGNVELDSTLTDFYGNVGAATSILIVTGKP